MVYINIVYLEIPLKLFFFRFVETYRIISRHRVQGTNAISTGDSFLLPFRKIACTRRSASDVIKWLSRPGVDKRVSRVGVSRSSRPIKPRPAVFAASIVILHPLSYFFASFPVLPVSRGSSLSFSFFVFSPFISWPNCPDPRLETAGSSTPVESGNDDSPARSKRIDPWKKD